MKVTLLASTENAQELLVFTKRTRLQMSADGFEKIFELPEAEIKAELEYMVNTIKSSWEFMDMTFMIEGVSRAFTHQFVRNRTGSYAQQTMRILEMDGFEYVTGPGIKTTTQKMVYDDCMDKIQRAYDELIKLGVPIEDARGILPTNICTNIVVKHNLRSLSQMMASRASSRTQSEYRDVIEGMYQEAVKKHPWVAEFLRDGKTKACNRLESIIHNYFDGTAYVNDYIKLVDQIRNA
ncbi:putative thymidylate synthase [Vibrio phage vB_ValP_VA-RY-3]|nr:putative thymidylate synthase [Vibrio phage vB_ValP_VA-RY-3]